MGCLAGDAQSYILFCDFFDRIIESYHGYKVTSDAVHESDFNYDNLKVRKTHCNDNKRTSNTFDQICFDVILIVQF